MRRRQINHFLQRRRREYERMRKRILKKWERDPDPSLREQATGCAMVMWELEEMRAWVEAKYAEKLERKKAG